MESQVKVVTGITYVSSNVTLPPGRVLPRRTPTLHEDVSEAVSYSRDIPGAENTNPEALFAVFNLETTGFSPPVGDRIIEVAIIQMAADGSRLTIT